MKTFHPHVLALLLVTAGTCPLSGGEPRQARELAKLTGHQGPVSAVAFSPDGSRLVTGGWDTTARLWDLKTSKELLSTPAQQGGIWYIAFSPDGRFFLTGGGDGENKGGLWDAQTGQLVGTFPPKQVLGSDWLETGPLRRSTPGHRQRVEVVGFSPDGKRALTGSNDGKVLVWDTATGDHLLTLPNRNLTHIQIHAAAFSPDGRSIAIALHNRLSFWDATNGAELRTFDAHTNWIEALAFFPDSERLATASYDGSARVWDVTTGAELVVFRGHRGPQGLICCVAVSPDGQQVATGANDMTARVWDAQTGEEQLVLKGHKGVLDAIAFSPDGRQVATTADDGTARIWEVAPAVNPAADPQATALNLETDYVPMGIRVPGSLRSGNMHSIRLVGKVPVEGDGEADVWLDTRTAELNAFGDVLARSGPEVEPIRVTLRRVATDELQTPGERVFHPYPGVHAGFRLYDLVFPGGALGGRIRLSLGTTRLGPHRLLVRALGGDSSPPSHRPSFLSILPLQGEPAVGSIIPDDPLNAMVHCNGYYTAVDGRIKHVDVTGTLGESGRLLLDPNYISFDPYGDLAMTTLMGWQPHQVTVQDTGTADPMGKGRRLYRLQPESAADTNRVSLVLGPTEQGPHRLLLYQGEKPAFIIPLGLPERRRHEILAIQLPSVSAGEQEAVAQLREAIGNGFDYQIRDNQVVTLSVSSSNGRLPAAGTLAKLPHLQYLMWYQGQWPASILPHLSTLMTLKDLSFSAVRLGKGALAPLSNLRQLESLSFRDCKGLNDDEVRHLTALTGLKQLSFYTEEILRQDPTAGECITDSGLAHLNGLVQLENLDLFGHNLSDASVQHLVRMTELKELALSGRGFTDTGLQGLTNLTKLRSLRLFETGVTTNGVASFKTRLPGVQIEAWGRDSGG